MWDFEEERKKHLAGVHELIRSLGLSPEDLAANQALRRKTKKPIAKPVVRKRKLSVSEEEETDGNSNIAPKKTCINDGPDEPLGTGLRRSQRNRGKKVDYSKDNIGEGQNLSTLVPASVKAGTRTSAPRSVETRTYDP